MNLEAARMASQAVHRAYSRHLSSCGECVGAYLCQAGRDLDRDASAAAWLTVVSEYRARGRRERAS